eukprot:NODE_11420_length_1288_cov_2.972438.p1 GENE.NODE_11420_length_1288_cov_2.972438~~NODE_11420_length_1288_cov_2.972438.p1  ORF type:complete len:402 (-),score=118.58 NODE_11420_length_1288_cov_2.972438:82-1173(-)
MGNQATRHQAVTSDNTFDIDAHHGVRHMLICAIDYKKTPNPLTCTMDGENMRELAGACGISDLEVMFDEECQSALVAERVRAIGARCKPGDFFIFYYAGHGTNVEDVSGDEDDGQDEALCFVDAAGQVSLDTVMTDDTFADLMTSSLHDEVRVVILTDCCHSGTIADLGKDEWNDHQAISMTGCLDTQTSGDTGRGGIFTHSMLLAIDKFNQANEQDYSVGALYNATLNEDDSVFDSAQDICIQCSNAVDAGGMAWPFVPLGEYTAPMHRAKKIVTGNREMKLSGGRSADHIHDLIGGHQSGKTRHGVRDMLHKLANDHPGELQQMGVAPSQMQHVSKRGIKTDADHHFFANVHRKGWLPTCR